MSHPPRPQLVRRTLVDELAQGMLDYISENGYVVGQKLPSLAALAAHFGVATPTLRETARRLESTGVLAIRHGSGMYVTGATERLVLINPAHGVLSQDTMLEVLDTRLLIEPELASRAAASRNAEQLEELEEMVAASAEIIRSGARGDTRLNELNMSFHIRIGTIAGNRVLAEALQSVIELNMDQQDRIASLYANMEQDHEEHVRILAALSAGDSVQARALMESHLAGVRHVIADRSGDAV